MSASEIATIYNITVINSPSNITFETNITAIPTPSCIVTLNWTDNSNNEANFTIERSSDGLSFVQIAEVGANTTTYTDTNLITSTKYYYRLKATNKTDSSTYSEVFNVTTPTDNDNDGYAETNDCNDNDPTIHEPILYYVDADKDGFGSTTTAMLCSSVAPEGYATNNTDCDDTNAIQLRASIPDAYAINNKQEKNTIYIGYGASSLSIKAIPSGGTAPYSYTWGTNQTTQAIAVSQPGSYTVIITDAKGCQTSASIDVIAINVQCGNSGDKVMVCHNGQEICISANAVQAHLNHGDKLGSCNNTPEYSIFENVTVFPNPVKTVLNIKVSKVYDKAELAVYTILARKVKSEPLTSTMQQMSMDDLNRGIYFLHVKNGQHYTIKAIIKE